MIVKLPFADDTVAVDLRGLRVRIEDDAHRDIVPADLLDDHPTRRSRDLPAKRGARLAEDLDPAARGDLDEDSAPARGRNLEDPGEGPGGRRGDEPGRPRAVR